MRLLPDIPAFPHDRKPDKVKWPTAVFAEGEAIDEIVKSRKKRKKSKRAAK